MNLLPIVERELRSAAHKATSYWVRPCVALLAFIASSALLLTPRFGRFGLSQMGPELLGWLSALGFLYCLLADLHFTADCLSEERREGTLGLLLLTELKPLDVVLGKLAATSLNAFYGLVAFFPMLALPVLLGGVTGAEIWKMTLVLTNTVFFSLATGMMASAVSHREAQSQGLAASLLLGMTCGFWPLIVLWFVQKRFNSSRPPGEVLAVWALAVVLYAALIIVIYSGGLPLVVPAGIHYATWLLPSPAFAYYLGFHPQLPNATQYFWGSLVATNLAGWVFLLFASRSVRSLSAEEGARSELRSKEAKVHERSGIDVPVRGSKNQARLLDQNPVQWLAALGSRTRAGVWWLSVFYILGTFGLFAAPSVISGAGGGPLLAIALGFVPFLGLMYVLAAQAGRFFIEGRRSGALELILVTPITREQILAGPWLALKRTFLPPFLVLEFFQLAQFVMYKATLSPSDHVPGWGSWLLYQAANAAGMVALFFAGGWMGMWQAWAGNKASVVAIKTVLVVVFMPTLVFYFTPLGRLIPTLVSSISGEPGLAPLLHNAQGVAVSLGIIAWARKRIRKAIGLSGAEAKMPRPRPGVDLLRGLYSRMWGNPSP